MKNQSKKILLLAGVCSLMLGTGVWAFFQKTLDVSNPFSTGKAKVYLNETFDVDDKWVPGEEKQKEVCFGNDGSTAVVLRAKFSTSLQMADGSPVTDETVLNGFQLNYADSFKSEWEEHDGWYYYTKVLDVNSKTDITLKSVTISSRLSNDVHGIQEDYSKATMDVVAEGEMLQSTVTEGSAELENWEYYPQVSGTTVTWIKK